MNHDEIKVSDNDGNVMSLSYYTQSSRLVSGYIRINGTIAGAMLECNHEPQKGVKGTNRRSGPRSINKYAQQKLDGLWIPTNQGIGFSEDGRLTDGAHRLKAIVKASLEDPGYGGLYLVCGGLPSRARLKVDTGRTRSKAQMLTMEGYSQSVILQAAVRLVHAYDNVKFFDDSSWTKENVMEIEDLESYLEKYPEIEELVPEGNRMREWMRPQAATAALFLASKDCPQGNSAEFMDMVHHGLNMDALHPAYRLREHYKRHLTGMGGPTCLALWIKAFNFYLNDLDGSLTDMGKMFSPRFIKNEPYPRFLKHWVPPAPEALKVADQDDV